MLHSRPVTSPIFAMRLRMPPRLRNTSEIARRRSGIERTSLYRAFAGGKAHPISADSARRALNIEKAGLAPAFLFGCTAGLFPLSLVASHIHSPRM
jgi:hypothetical protein